MTTHLQTKFLENAVDTTAEQFSYFTSVNLQETPTRQQHVATSSRLDSAGSSGWAEPRVQAEPAAEPEAEPEALLQEQLQLYDQQEENEALIDTASVIPWTKPRQRVKRNMWSINLRNKRPISKSRVSRYRRLTKEVVCLPYSDQPVICIPRRKTRQELAKRGWIGQMTLSRDMSSREIAEQITAVFRDVFQLEEECLLDFICLGCLQGSGKKLQRPKVPHNFKWSGAEILSMCGQGCIYIMCAPHYGVTYQNFFWKTSDDDQRTVKRKKCNDYSSHPTTVSSAVGLGPNVVGTVSSMTRLGRKRKMASSAPPACATNAVLVQSSGMPADAVKVKGYDFNEGIDYHKLLQSYRTSGFQATNFGLAVEEINKMIAKKAEPLDEEEVLKGTELNPCCRTKSNCTIFLGYTSNLISSGLRETFRFLAQHNLVDCIVTTAGGIEEDFIKCLGDTYLGDFTLKGRELRQKGINRIGNLLVPNDNYCKFEDWLMPIFDQMLVEQDTQGVNWTPSKMIARLGKEINDPNSVYYWAYKNNIPVFSPALTDGSLGDILYFHSYKNPGLRLDIIEDIRRMNSQAVYAAHTGMIILGGGLVKHHICNANLMKNGADFSVFLNTAQEFDGSDSGARPDEAVSWGKIKMTASPVKVYGEATLLFPLIVAETFARCVHPPKEGTEEWKIIKVEET